MASGFSRLQLAAALLEYDNDPANPEAPHRSAHESAIFAHLRRNAGGHVPTAPRSSEVLDVPLPSESANAGNRGSIVTTVRSRASRSSIDALRNPFGADDHLESDDEVEGGGLEVDLTSWGLDAFMLKDKPLRHNKGKVKTIDVDPPHPVSSVPSHHPLTNNDAIRTSPSRALGASRSMSVGGNLEYFGIDKAVLERQLTHKADTRRRSIGSPLDFVGIEIPGVHVQRRRASSHTIFQTSIQNVPFPTTSVPFPSPYDNSTRPTFQTGTTSHPHERVLSSMSADSKMHPGDEGRSAMTREQRTSTITTATMMLVDDNPFAVKPPSHASRFDPKTTAHGRTLSNASQGSRFLLDDHISVATGHIQSDRDHRRSTTLDLLRPKVLVMPSPLQPPVPSVSSPNENIRDGFQSTTDGPPLPPGARSSRRASVTLSTIQSSPPNPSNPFTPNPLITLSLSQQTFRNTLTVGGQRNSGYMDETLPRAVEDGDQAQFEALDLEDHQSPVLQDLDNSKAGRPAGKLYGKSLIDDLESRKAQMRGKQRVFTGDQRPSMMVRGSQQRTSTLIDLAALQMRPVSQHIDSHGPAGSQQALGRPNSVNAKPLLNFDQENKLSQTNKSPYISSSRSVFGVDTLWEREMAKLKIIESRERLQEEERKKLEETNDLKKDKRKKKKDKLNANIIELHPTLIVGETKLRVSAEPPTLPDIQQAPRRKPPQIDDNDTSESDGSQAAGPLGTQVSHEDWYAGSSEEDNNDVAPHRTTGTGPRITTKYLTPAISGDSDDDVPLATTINRAIQGQANSRSQDGHSDDDERPLSTLLPKKQMGLPSIFSHTSNSKGRDEDDQPLGLRILKLGSSHSDDDDRPLAYHPEQQRRTQYHMMAQQQQQMVLQAQMQNSMFFTPPSMIGSPYFGPAMMPMMIQPPIQIPSPPPMHDEAKYGRVDRWRRDVAIEGDM